MLNYMRASFKNNMDEFAKKHPSFAFFQTDIFLPEAHIPSRGRRDILNSKRLRKYSFLSECRIS